MAPGGFGLHTPLIDPGFNSFDPFDERHFCISHHLAHAYYGFGSSGFSDAAVLVCDMAGSSTHDGNDYCLPFRRWHDGLTSFEKVPATKTETLSIYHATMSGIELKERQFWISHVQPHSYIQSATTLYENVSFAVFRRHNCHGQLMALAAFSDEKNGLVTWESIIDTDSACAIQFKNNWQHRIPTEMTFSASASLAHACQIAFEYCILAHVRNAKRLVLSDNLVGSGGAFLNIPANTKVYDSHVFNRYFVPSAPHDAGISAGCAFWGDRFLRREQYFFANTPAPCRANDRLGVQYSRVEILDALRRFDYFVEFEAASPTVVAEKLFAGRILARYSGRAEFGPRALGGRSLLASPLLEATKVRMNHIKGRQPWRPVAPVILENHVHEFFVGPASSPYMLFSYRVRPEVVDQLPALHHPDNSTRPQTLQRADDEDLYDLISAFSKLSGVPILVNTSLNGAGEAMIETPNEAVQFFLDHEDVDDLLIDGWMVSRRGTWDDERLKNLRLRLPSHTRIELVLDEAEWTAFVHNGRVSQKMSLKLAGVLVTCTGNETAGRILQKLDDEATRNFLYKLLAIGLVEVDGDPMPIEDNGGTF